VAERESIIADLQSRLWAIEGIGLVERNLEEMGDITKYPAVFIVDVIDEPGEALSRRGYKREWTVELWMFLTGSSKNAAPGELDALRGKVKTAMHSTGGAIGKITGQKGFVQELATSAMIYGEQGNHVLMQGVQFKIHYIESRS